MERDGSFEAAAAEYFRLAAAFEQAGDEKNHFHAQLRGAQVLLEAGSYDRVRTALPELRANAGAHPARQAWVANVEGRLERDTGTLQSALSHAERSLTLARESGDREAEAAALGLLQSVHWAAGRYEQALVLARERLALEQDLEPDGKNVAAAWNQLANVLQATGRYTEAIEAYEHALGINRKNGDRLGIAINQLNQGNVYYATGQYPEAFTMHYAALETSKSIDDTYGIVLVHSNFGNMFRQVGNLEAARGHIAEAFAILKEFEAPELVVATWEFLGRLEHEDGNYPAAEEAYLTALRLAEDRGNLARAATQKAWLARNSAARGDHAAALDWAAGAVAEAREIGAPDILVSSLCSSALAQEKAGRLEAARATYGEAIDYIESWRGRLGFGDQKMSLAACHLEVYEGAIRVLLALGRPGEAFDVSERVRARRLLDLVNRAPADPRVAAEQAIADLEASLRARYPEAQAADGAAAERLSRELAALAGDIEERKAALRRSEPVAGTARYPVPARVSDVTQHLLGGDGALLAYFWGERDVYGWWIERGRVTAERLGTVAEMARRIAFLRAAMQDSAGVIDWRAAAAGFWTELVAPLAPSRRQQVFLVPDGPLGHVPYAGLLAPGDALPWGATRRLVQAPSAAILLALARAPDSGRFERELLAVGGRVAEASDGAPRPRTDESLPLPFADREVADIAALFPPRTRDVLTGREGTLERWRALEPGRYRYLHFATHARVSDLDPLETGLVMPQSGRLGLAGIRAQRLGTELVTLSGCETALGRQITGEGLLALPHAFLAAGARGVLVTLWRVEDRATAEFVTRFYTWLREGEPPAEALRRTREEWLSGSYAGDAAAWSSFVLIGGAG